MVAKFTPFEQASRYLESGSRCTPHFGVTDLAPTRQGENYVGSVRRIVAVLLKRIADTLVPDNVDVTGMV